MRSAAAPADFERALAARLAKYDGPAPVTEMIRYHFAPGADRLRARVVLAACEEEGGLAGDALGAACAIEIVGNFAVVHLDIMTDTRTRFGQPNVLERFERAQAINTGDALAAIGFLALLDSKRPPERTAAMSRVLHEAHLAMCAEHSRNPLATEDDHRMTWARTAALIAAACRLGALAAGASGPRVDEYGELGEALARGVDGDALAQGYDIDRGRRVRTVLAA